MYEKIVFNPTRKVELVTSGLDDIERPLNKRGKLNAPFMGARLKNTISILT